MNRYNCKNGPVDMVECDDGYWVKHKDVIGHIDDLSNSVDYYVGSLNMELNLNKQLGSVLEEESKTISKLKLKCERLAVFSIVSIIILIVVLVRELVSVHG